MLNDVAKKHELYIKALDAYFNEDMTLFKRIRSDQRLSQLEKKLHQIRHNIIKKNLIKAFDICKSITLKNEESKFLIGEYYTLLAYLNWTKGEIEFAGKNFTTGQEGKFKT